MGWPSYWEDINEKAYDNKFMYGRLKHASSQEPNRSQSWPRRRSVESLFGPVAQFVGSWLQVRCTPDVTAEG
jgi:hypothetical protein